MNQTHPPRMRHEDAVLDLVAASRSPLDRIQLLADACRSGRTTASRLLAALARRPRVRDRRWLEAVLHDIAEGTCSVLEHGYLTLVERPRGPREVAPAWPIATRAVGSIAIRVRGASRERSMSDVSAERDLDLERDLGRALTDPAWLGSGFGRPCRTAVKIGSLFASRGWTGTVRACGRDCEAA